jgi:hypothetical protein
MALAASILVLALTAVQAPAPVADAAYYAFWPGTWCALADGAPQRDQSCFIVRPGAHAAAFEEEWVQVADGQRLLSRAMRAWDPIEQRWMLVWVSAEGHFQIWHGTKAGSDWYIVRAFEQGGQAFLSRQAWIPTGKDRLVRVMERSFDNGTTWQPRSRTEFARVQPETPRR